MIRSLVLAPNWVGDNVMALPTLAALAASGRRLTVLARPHLEPLLAMVPAVAEIVPRASSTADTVAALRAAGCDEAVVLPGSFRSAWLARQARLGRRWGYRGDWRAPLLAPGVTPPARRGRPQIEDYARLLAAMDVPPPASWVPSLEPSAAARAAAQERLERAPGLAGDGPLVALAPGAAFGPSKRWAPERFAKLAREVRRAVPGVRQTIVAGPDEVWLAVRVHEDSGHLHPVIGPDLDLAELAAVLARCDLLVTNDSGPMHLAAAVGVPCLALFGPTDPRRTAPAGDGHRVLYTDRWCSPCFKKRCPLLHNRCMKDLGVAEVVEAAVEMLNRRA